MSRRRRGGRASWRDQVDDAGVRPRAAPRHEPKPIVVTPRSKRFIDAQRERLLGVDALGRKIEPVSRRDELQDQPGVDDPRRR